LRVSDPFYWDKKEGTIKDDVGSIYSSLHYSSRLGLAEATKLLLTNGININATGGRLGTCLAVAAENGYDNLVQIFLEHGADLRAMSETGSTALHRATSNGHEASVRLLIQAGAEVAAQDRRGETALHKAACCGTEEVSKLLLEHGARFGDTTLYGDTALHMACLYGHASAVRLLLEWDADVTVLRGGETALHLVAEMYESGETVNLLLAKGANAESITDKNESVLYCAARLPSPTTVRVRLEHSARTSSQKRMGW
jgi:ankyrin repeat protein